MLPDALSSISVVNTEPFNLSSFALSLLLVIYACASCLCWAPGLTGQACSCSAVLMYHSAIVMASITYH